MGDRRAPNPPPSETGARQVKPSPPPAPPRRETSARCTIGEYCRLHQFVHGAEAEELRERLEALGDPRVTAILEDVDARDSAAFCDSPSAKLLAAAYNVVQMATISDGAGLPMLDGLRDAIEMLDAAIATAEGPTSTV